MNFTINDYSVVVVRCCLLVETQMSWKHFIWDQSITVEVDNFFGWITWFSGGTERGSVVANKVYTLPVHDKPLSLQEPIRLFHIPYKITDNIFVIGPRRTEPTKFVLLHQKSLQNLSPPNFQFFNRGRTEKVLMSWINKLSSTWNWD